jgi:hypothetical protein
MTLTAFSMTAECGKGRSSSKYVVQVSIMRERIKEGNKKTLRSSEQQEKLANRGDTKAPLQVGQKAPYAPVRGDSDIEREEISTQPNRGTGTFSTGRSFQEKNVSLTQPSTAKRAFTDGRRHGHSLIEKLKDLTDARLDEFARQIAVRHPWGRLRNWTLPDVPYGDVKAILEAMANEAQLTGVTMADAARTLLASLDAWDEVGRETWQSIASISDFYKQGHHRIRPGAGDVGNPIDRHSSTYCCDSGNAGPEAGSDHSEVQSDEKGVQVAAVLNYPPRIQWPRRNG